MNKDHLMEKKAWLPVIYYYIKCHQLVHLFIAVSVVLSSATYGLSSIHTNENLYRTLYNFCWLYNEVFLTSQEKRGCPLIRACSLIWSNTVFK